MGSKRLNEELTRLVGKTRGSQQTREARDTLAVLQGLLDPLPFAALVADANGQYVAVNDRAARLTGYTAPELLRLSVWQLTPGTDERDREVLWRAFLQQHVQSGAYRLLAKDGRLVMVQYAAQAHILPGLHLSLLEPAV